MSTDIHGRGHAPSGVRIGGQFTTQLRAESGTVLTVPARDLDDAMEFNHPVRVLPDGAVDDGPSNVYAPELYVDTNDNGQDVPGTDEELRAQARRQGWELLAGYTGQYGYRGPVMHSSEHIGGRLRDDILASPGLYVAVPVEVTPTDDDSEPEPAGWAVARRIDD